RAGQRCDFPGDEMTDCAAQGVDILAQAEIQSGNLLHRLLLGLVGAPCRLPGAVAPSMLSSTTDEHDVNSRRVAQEPPATERSAHEPPRTPARLPPCRPPAEDRRAHRSRARDLL